jgi:tRNA(fMet)-specific endonuclease VapC
VKYLLDTDHISILQRQASPEYAVLSARMAQHQPDDFAFSIISFHEQVIGCHTYLSQARNSADLGRGYRMLGQVITDFAAATVLPFDDPAAAGYDGLSSSRLRVAAMDLRIAAIALSRWLTLLTRNARDFGCVPGLVFENWTV